MDFPPLQAGRMGRAPGLPAMAFTFRPLTADSLPLLHEWLQRPHVRAWWSEPSTIADLKRDYASGANDPSTAQAYFVFQDERAIGFIQSYRVLGAGDGWWPDETDPGATGIDQFLADPAQLGRGLGSAMIRAFVQRLFADPQVT